VSKKMHQKDTFFEKEFEKNLIHALKRRLFSKKLRITMHQHKKKRINFEVYNALLSNF